MERLRPHFPKVRGKARSDDRTVLSGIIHMEHNGLRWRDAPAVYGPHKTPYNRFVRWSRLGVFARMFRQLAQPGAEGDTPMMESTHLKAHHTAASLSRGALPQAIGRTKGGLNSKLHMVSDGRGRPLNFFLSPGQMSDPRGALVLLAELPAAKRILGDRGYDADWLRDELKARPAHMHPRPPRPPSPRQPQSPALQKALPDRERLRPPQRLESHRHRLHEMRRPVPIGHLPRRHCPLLAAEVSPEPKPIDSTSKWLSSHSLVGSIPHHAPCSLGNSALLLRKDEDGSTPGPHALLSPSSSVGDSAKQKCRDKG